MASTGAATTGGTRIASGTATTGMAVTGTVRIGGMRTATIGRAVTGIATITTTGTTPGADDVAGGGGRIAAISPLPPAPADSSS